MDAILLKRNVAALLLAGILLSTLAGCGAADCLPEATHSGEYTATTDGTEEIAGTAASVSTTNSTGLGGEATEATQGVLPGTGPTVPAEPAQCTHKYEQWVTVQPAACTEDGMRNRKCSLCGEEEQAVLSAIGHSYGGWEEKTAASCETPGVRQRLCVHCGNTEQENLPAVGHSWDGGKVEGTNAECGGGETVYTCRNCGTARSEAIPANHSLGQWEYEAYSYTIYYEPGSLEYVHGGPSSTHDSHRRIRTCTKCGFVEKDNTPDHSCKRGSVNHKVSVIREVTCQQRGIKRTTCGICGWYEDYEYGDSDDGHAWVSETRHLTDRTETTNYLDVEIITCTACGKVLYYYRWGSDHCICGKTPCVAEGDWRGCEGYCLNNLMYDDLDVTIDSRAYIFGYGNVFGDSYYVSTSDNQFKHNPDGYILHPTWQTVRRNYVFNENGEIIQFTVLWHDEQGNLFSDVVVVTELKELFLSSGFEEEDFSYLKPCLHLTPFQGKLYPTSISGTV